MPVGWALEGERQLTVEVPKTDALTTDIVCESGTSLKKVTLDMIKVVTIEADPMTGLKEIGDPAKAPKERTYIVPLAAANDQNPTPVTVEAKLDRHLNESELPAGWTLEGGIGGQKLVRRIARMNRAGPFVTNITFTGNGVDAGVKTTINVLSVDLVPDFNHDRVIDNSDKGKVTAANPFRFWINDDADFGDESSDDSDIPGKLGGIFGNANYANSQVDGRSDLLDFFPVWLDVHEALTDLPPSDTVQYKLKQANNAVKAVYTDLTKAHAGDFLTTEGNTYCGASSFEVTSSGVTLSTDFLDKIKNDATKGILLIEGAGSTTAPLILEIWKDGVNVYAKEMPLKLSDVETMYRCINLRPSGNGGLPTSTGQPANNPDSLSNGKNVIFLHGFNVTADESRGWNAEMFKRLYQSGSRAMYTAVI